MSEREPLVPADCDLRGLPWMPIDTVRLLDSDLFALSSGDEFKAAVRLWCKAWHQVPAGSLPDDDRILAALSGMGRLWPKVRAMALRGYVKCSDGRLYHPVICEKALEAFDRRDDFIEKTSNNAERQRRWRDRQKQLSDELRALGVTPPQGASLSTLKTLLVDARNGDRNADGNGPVMPLTGQDSTGKKDKDIVELTLDGDHPPGKNGADSTRVLRSQAVELLTFLNEKAGRNYQPVPVNVDMIVARLKEGATLDQCRQVIAKKCREWLHDETMNEYLRPATLFNRTKFAQYQGELVAPGGTH